MPGLEWLDEEEGWRFVRLSCGAAYWLGSGRPRSLFEGELVIIPPKARALVRASQLNEVVLHGFGFAPDLLCGFFTLAERHFLAGGGCRAGETVEFLPSTHPFAQHFSGLVSSRKEGPEAVRKAEALRWATGFLCNESRPPRLPKTGSSTAHGRFQEIVVPMTDMELIQHTPAHLAELCGCSARHFNRMFRHHFGLTPRAQQTDLRLLRARQLLKEAEGSIAQIALDSGYRSVSLFNSLFRRRFGMSPSEWRQKSGGV